MRARQPDCSGSVTNNGVNISYVAYEMAEDFHAHLPHSHLVTFERGGHALTVRDPVKVNHLIRDYFGFQTPRQRVFTERWDGPGERFSFQAPSASAYSAGPGECQGA